MKRFIGFLFFAVLVLLLAVFFLHIEKHVYDSRKFRVRLNTISFNTPESYQKQGLEKAVRNGMKISPRCSIFSEALLEQIYEACRKCHYIREITSVERRLPDRIQVTAEWRIPCAYVKLPNSENYGLVDSTGSVLLKEFTSIPDPAPYPMISGITCMRTSENPMYLKENDMLKDALDALMIISRHIPDGSVIQIVKIIIPPGKNERGCKIVFCIHGSNWKSEIIWGKHIRKGGPFPGYIRPFSEKINDLQKSVSDGRLPPILDLEFY